MEDEFIQNLKADFYKLSKDSQALITVSDDVNSITDTIKEDLPSVGISAQIIRSCIFYFYSSGVKFQASEIFHQVLKYYVNFLKFFSKRLSVLGWDSNLVPLFLELLNSFSQCLICFSTEDLKAFDFTEVLCELLNISDIYNPRISFGDYEFPFSKASMEAYFLKVIPMKKEFALEVFSNLSKSEIKDNSFKISAVPMVNFVEVYSNELSPKNFAFDFVAQPKILWEFPDVILREFSIEKLYDERVSPSAVKRINHNYLSIKTPISNNNEMDLLFFKLNYLMRYDALKVAESVKCGNVYGFSEKLEYKKCCYRVLIINIVEDMFTLYKVDTGEILNVLSPTIYVLPHNLLKHPYCVQLAQIAGVSPKPSKQILTNIARFCCVNLWKDIWQMSYIIAQRGAYIFKSFLYFDKSTAFYGAKALHRLSESKELAVSCLNGLELDLLDLIKQYSDVLNITMLKIIIPILQNLQYYSPALARNLAKCGLQLELLRLLHTDKSLTHCIWECLRAPVHAFILFQVINKEDGIPNKKKDCAITSLPKRLAWTKKLVFHNPSDTIIKQYTVFKRELKVVYAIVQWQDFSIQNIAKRICAMLNSQDGGMIYCGIKVVGHQLVIDGVYLNNMEVTSIKKMLQALPDYFLPSFPSSHVELKFEKVIPDAHTLNTSRSLYLIKCEVLPDVDDCFQVKLDGAIAAYTYRQQKFKAMSAQEVRHLTIMMVEKQYIMKKYKRLGIDCLSFAKEIKMG